MNRWRDTTGNTNDLVGSLPEELVLHIDWALRLVFDLSYSITKLSLPCITSKDYMCTN